MLYFSDNSTKSTRPVRQPAPVSPILCVISASKSPLSANVAPRYLNVFTLSKFSLYILISEFPSKFSSSIEPQVGETGVSWDTFHFLSNITENIYDIYFELTRQGRTILPLHIILIRYVVTSFVTTEYGVNDMWSNCPNLPRHRVGWDSTRGSTYRDIAKGVHFRLIASEVTNVHRNCVCACMCVHVRVCTGIRRPTRRKLYTNA